MATVAGGLVLHLFFYGSFLNDCSSGCVGEIKELVLVLNETVQSLKRYCSQVIQDRDCVFNPNLNSSVRVGKCVSLDTEGKGWKEVKQLMTNQFVINCLHFYNQK